jgi:hypothetical protein
MRTKPNVLSSLIKLAACAALVLSVAAQAEEKKADPVGTWTWTMPGRQGGPDRTNTLTFKKEGDKLVGSLSAPGRGGQAAEVKIEDAKVTGDELTFSVTRETQAGKFVSKYNGKISGDSIKGKVEVDRGDGNAPVSRDWEAKRQAAAK